ncbi:GNT1, partial [Symbiodinium pilosum]
MRFRCAITVLSLLIAVLESRRNPSDQQEPVAVLQLQRSQNTNFRSTNTFAYVWYLANRDEDIACGILVAAAAVSAHGLRNSTDLVVIHNAGVPRPERFRKAGIKLVEVPSAVSKGEVTWRESFMKLRASQLFQYDRVIYFDVDTLPLGSLDNLFNIANFPIEIAAPRAYWL